MQQRFWAVYRRRSVRHIAYQCYPLRAPTPEGAVAWAERRPPQGRGWRFLFLQAERPKWAPWICRRVPSRVRAAA